MASFSRPPEEPVGIPATLPKTEILEVATSAEIPAEIRQFGLKIDRLNLLVPVIKNVDGTNKTLYNRSLKKGVAHYLGTALPGEVGNVFIFGHSSSAFDNGPYAKAFEKLNDLKKGDLITVYFENKEIVYQVTGIMVVAKDDLAVLNQTSEKILTLMTCWPVGTNEKRLIVKSVLISNE